VGEAIKVIWKKFCPKALFVGFNAFPMGQQLLDTVHMFYSTLLGTESIPNNVVYNIFFYTIQCTGTLIDASAW